MPIPDALLMRLPRRRGTAASAPLPSPQNAFLGAEGEQGGALSPTPSITHTVIFLPVFMTGLLLGDLVIDFCLYVHFWNW